MLRLESYLGNRPEAAWRHGFEVIPRAPLAYSVERDPLPGHGESEIAIEQPYYCALRWDRLLASELGWSRSRIIRAWEREIFPVNGSDGPVRARDHVRDQQRVRVVLVSPP